MPDTPATRSVPLGFGDLTVPVPSHVCLFYYDDTELRERLPFLRIGLETPGEAVVLFGTPTRLEEVTGYLAADYGRDVSADLAAGRMVLVDGADSPEQLLANIGQALDRLMEAGVKLIRFFGFIGWQEADWPSHDDLLAFESAVNQAVANYPAVAVCTYRLTELSGPLLIYGGIETHPYTVIGSTICENPHYLSPERFTVDRSASLPWHDAARPRFPGLRIRKQPDEPIAD